MHTRDAHGRKVSLLNDDLAYHSAVSHRLSYRTASNVVSRPYPTPRSSSSSPNTPELLRSDSYDSNTSNDPISPLTPSLTYDYGNARTYSQYDDYVTEKRPSYQETNLPQSYEDEITSDRPGKRYPCRYRDSHGCEKTFTTSGHASRHSKIHTAEKAVQCTFHGCQKKFTRADNMKQHLETHYKDKSKSSGAHRPPGKSLASTGRKYSSSSRSSGSSKSGRDSTAWESEQFSLPTPSGHTSLTTPGASDAWDLRGFNLPLLSRPSVVRAPSSGLDALAMAIACQEGT